MAACNLDSDDCDFGIPLDYRPRVFTSIAKVRCPPSPDSVSIDALRKTRARLFRDCLQHWKAKMTSRYQSLDLILSILKAAEDVRYHHVLLSNSRTPHYYIGANQAALASGIYVCSETALRHRMFYIQVFSVAKSYDAINEASRLEARFQGSLVAPCISGMDIRLSVEYRTCTHL